MMAYVTEICPQCGNLRSVCSDPEQPWYPHLSRCYATADQEVLVRRLQAKHKEEPGSERHPLDGLAASVLPFNPDA